MNYTTRSLVVMRYLIFCMHSMIFIKEPGFPFLVNKLLAMKKMDIQYEYTVCPTYCILCPRSHVQFVVYPHYCRYIYTHLIQ